MKKIIYIAMAATMVACSGEKNEFDATGVFEATEVTVSAEQTGKLLTFDVTEGSKVDAGVEVGLVDTVQLYLKARQIGATKLVYSAQMPEVQKQLAGLKQQLEKARQEEARFASLVKEGASNQKVLDDASSQVAVLQKQVDALQSTLQNSTNSLSAQMNTADVQQLQVIDQLHKCHISSPISGVVLEKYAECGEFTAIGKPLFKVADINNIYLRAYITADQLTGLKLGQKVRVYADQGKDGRKEYEGTLTWIADKAEFTPKTIQTRDERANLVYAIKVSVKNDGLIKMGMYGEIKL
uniref:Putative membrane protein n=1 Tax=uncultured bacterium fosmid pJB69A5 TaxID=1478067 RepID=A0A0H3U7X7_9BACT|nr:putative membrane protein [uncultured bacterium fosmid pJB69A5]